ncbi:hypothetical protein [Sphingomonas sp. GM_Shp_2]|uniref:hypothetical protein n=1 Tax=Sphingomonas sp. GM_Shp_2 TaxID=2937380 RepID=UPI00226AEA86|nr:hypothetical protein [Sphingomonas sp. GM_Shp_2]
MTAALTRRLAALEAKQPRQSGRRFLLMPWDIIPEQQDGDMIGYYNLVAAGPDGPKRVDYQRTGIHPKDDAAGSWNRHLHFGEPLHA